MYIALLKFDFFFIFGSQLQVLLAEREINEDFILNASMVPIAILTLVLAARFCRNENTKSMSIPIVSLSVSSLKPQANFHSSFYAVSLSARSIPW